MSNNPLLSPKSILVDVKRRAAAPIVAPETLRPLAGRSVRKGSRDGRLHIRRLAAEIALRSPAIFWLAASAFPLSIRTGMSILLQTFSAQSIHDHTTNDGRQHFWIGSCDPSRYEARRSEVPGNDLPLLQNFCSLLGPHSKSKRARHIVRNRPARRKLQNSFFDGVVSNPGKNGRLHFWWSQDEQPGGRAGSP